MPARKVYEIQINGVSTSITNVEKLNDTLDALDKNITAVNTAESNATKQSSSRAKSLSDEEKAAKKLADTRAKTAKVLAGETDEQVKANLELQEAIRQKTRAIKVNQYEETSIRGIGVRLAEMRENYKLASEEQRAFLDANGQGAAAIQALDAQYKTAKESLGEYQDSVGNYGKALQGFGKNLQSINQIGIATAQTFLAGSGIMTLFGKNTEEDAEKAAKLQKVLTVLNLVQQISNKLISAGTKGVISNTLALKAQTTQTVAKTAAESTATKGTTLATIAQAAFNKVAAMNPYVLLALALASVIGALVLFSKRTDAAVKSQERLNNSLAYQAKIADASFERYTRDSKARQTAAEAELQRLQRTGASQARIAKQEDKIFAERAEQLRVMRKEYAPYLAALEENENKLSDINFQIAQLELNEKKLDKTQKALLENLKGQATLLSGAISKAKEVQNAENQLTNDMAAAEYERAQAAIAAEKTAEDARRAAADARVALEENTFERQRQTAIAANERAIADLRTRLKQEKELTADARKAINDQIVSLQAKLSKDLLDIDRAQRDAERAILRQAEDSKNDLIENQFDRERAITMTQYKRQREDLQRQLDEDKSLTQAGRDAILQVIKDSGEKEKEALRRIKADELNDQIAANERTVAAVETGLQEVRQRIGEVVARSKTGLQFIDVAKTKENLQAVNNALKGYITGLEQYKADMKKTHDDMLKTLKVGSAEYEVEVQRYAQAVVDADQKIIASQKEVEANSKASRNAMVEGLKDLLSKIGEQAQVVADGINTVMETLSMGLQTRLDELNEALEQLNEQYDEVVKKREDSATRIEQIEKDMQAAQGGNLEALRERLQAEMSYRDDLAREEQRIAKEKEKREAEIAKKEKQLKRVQVVQDIVQAGVNTALGVTRMLSLVWPLNLIMAAVVGAAGAVQIGFMSRQLAKLADGGLIEGPSHAQGGVRVAGTNIEVEGGEYVVNKESTGKNQRLIEYINGHRDVVTARDLVGVIPNDTSPATSVSLQSTDNEIIDAINSIDIRPVVSVQEIIDVGQQMTTAQELAGFPRV